MTVALEAILPQSASVCVTREDDPDAVLLPAEAAAVDGAVERRRREFATGRACARAALGRWGLAHRAVPTGLRGEPIWPAGIVGSITHCDGFRACAAARDVDCRALGIDAEPNLPVSPGVLAAVAISEERVATRRLGQAMPGICWDRLLFSAKESVFKAWHSLTGRRLRFEDIVVAVGPWTGAFSARLPVDGEDPCGRRRWLAGRWALDAELVLTAVAVHRR